MGVDQFDWYSNGTYRGRELFSGTYASNGFLNFSGFQLVNPIAIQLSNYRSEVLSPSQIDNGTWGAIGISGTWFATNLAAFPESDPNTAAVPEPSSMLGLGIVALGGAMLKRHTKRKALQ